MNIIKKWLIPKQAEKSFALNQNLSTIKPKIVLPKTLQKRRFKDQTIFYTYQPPRPYLSTLPPLNDFLIRESVEEKLSKLEDNQRLLTFAKLHLPLHGVLKKKGTHFYLEISPQLSRVFPYGKSPTYQQRITVIHAQEGIKDSLPEEGMFFPFTLKGYYHTEPVAWISVKKAYLLLVESPALEALRMKKHLSPTPYGHDFHLLLSVDPAFDLREESHYYRVSISNHAV